MWFIIRAAFCIGVIYWLTPGAELTDGSIAGPRALVQAAAPALRDALQGALATCSNEPKLCLEAAELLASARSAAPTLSSKPEAPVRGGPLADTLTAADRAPPWHGPKEMRGARRAPAASRPET